MVNFRTKKIAQVILFFFSDSLVPLPSANLTLGAGTGLPGQISNSNSRDGRRSGGRPDICRLLFLSGVG